MPDFITLDVETLDVKPSAVILGIGFLAGDWEDASHPDTLNNGEEYFFHIKEQHEEMGRTISSDTVKWWSQQDTKDQVIGAPNKISVSTLPDILWNFVKSNPIEKDTDIVVHGPAFDIPIVESVFHYYDIKLPFPFWKVRDTRSIFDTLTGSHKGKDFNFEKMCREEYGLKKHSPLDDCKIDMMMLRAAAEGVFTK